jgi:hypothetical protein
VIAKLRFPGLVPALAVTMLLALAFFAPGGAGHFNFKLVCYGYPCPGVVVSGVNPASGPTSGGTTVIITGSGFAAATAVYFGSTAAASLVVLSDTQIRAVTPVHASGTVHVTVNTPGGNSTPDDTSDLFTFGPCTSAALSASPVSPQASGTTVSLTASSTGCLNPEYKFWLLPPGGSWTAQTGFGGNAFTWNTTGFASGVYQIGVWARNIGSRASYEAYFIGTYTLSVLTCTAADLSTVTPSPAVAGTLVTWTATATRCPGAQFRFWILPHGGSWTMTRDYGAATWIWNTTGLAAGTYEVGVWALQAGSTNTYDAYGITTFVIGAAACTSAGLSPSVAPPQVPGVTVTFTGSSTGCVSPQYQFWLLPPGGAWTIMQVYSATTTWAWNTTGFALGTYQVGLWAKAGASAASYDAFFIRTYQLDVGMCTSATISAAPASPQLSGTSITFTATAIGCNSPSFEFWELPAGSSTWIVVRAFAAGNTFVWNTTGLSNGPYRLGVWVLQNGSSNSYDSYAITTFWVGP